MPYESVSELPQPVRDHLPDEAQRIYQRAFNSAWEEYAGRSDREATAHRVAWSAVKRQYRKADGQWVHK